MGMVLDLSSLKYSEATSCVGDAGGPLTVVAIWRISADARACWSTATPEM